MNETALRSRGLAWARQNRLLVAAIAIGLIARIVFWAVTDRRLDDALITLKHVKNAADGLGLVHHLGEGHVQGFTSALSVLVPLPGELVAHGGGLLLIRLVSLGAFVATAVYAYRIARQLGLGPWPTGFALAYLALDMNQIFYGVAGMETQIAVAVLLAGVYYVLREDYVKSGVALGLALLARPDFVLWIGPAYVFLLIRNPRRALKAGLISAAVLGPWLIFTSLYYGSPIPNTIVAKNLAFGPHFPSLLHPGAWIHYIGHLVSARSHDWIFLAPFLERFFVLQTPLPYTLLKAIAFAVGALAIVGAVTTWRRASWRPAIAFACLFVIYKIVFVGFGYNEWYGPPAIAVMVLLAAAGLHRLSLLRPRLALVPAACLALGLAYAIQLPFTIPLEARVQHKIEDRVRVPLGQYLGRVVKPGQTYASESAGYVGFYTNGTLYDYPGLTSRTAVDALRKPGHLPGLYGIAAVLHPDWLVLRPGELAFLRQFDPQTARLYRPIRRFRVSEKSSSLSHWGLVVADVDREFIVLHRRP